MVRRLRRRWGGWSRSSTTLPAAGRQGAPAHPPGRLGYGDVPPPSAAAAGPEVAPPGPRSARRRRPGVRGRRDADAGDRRAAGGAGVGMTTPRLYKTEAIVLRQRKLGEADRILTLHTPAYGKLDAKAKGVRKTTSRMSGHLQPLSRCMVQLAQGRPGLDVIAGCETLESFQALREDLDRLSRALYAAELADRFLAERGGSMGAYPLPPDMRRGGGGLADAFAERAQGLAASAADIV